MTHLREILSVHDLSKDPAAGNFQEFARRSLDNVNNRCLHHHVFSETLIRNILEITGLKIISIEQTRSYFVTIAMKTTI
jgi:hypothetical protein